MVALAKPTFTATPKDQVDVVDVYTTVDSKLRNNLTSKLSSFGEDLSSIYGRSTENIGNIGNQIKNKGINLADAKDRIQRALTGSRSDITNIAKDIQTVMFGDVTGKDPGTDYIREGNKLLNVVKIVTSKGERISSGRDQNQVSSMLGIITDITGLSIFKSLDLGVETALIKGAIIEVGKWGVPELLDDILANTDKRSGYAAVSRSSRQLANTSDIDSVEALINRFGPSVLTSQTPNFAAVFLANYRFPNNVTPEQYSTRLAQLVRVMTQLQPNWFYTQRTYLPEGAEGYQTVTEEVANLAVLNTASAHAKLLFRSDETYAPYAMIASAYPTKSAKALLKEQYPRIAII